MAYLGKARKCDLLNLAAELDLQIPEAPTINKLKQIILESVNYDEEFTQSLLDTIVAERLENAEIQRIELENENKRRELENNFQLEKLRIECSGKDRPNSGVPADSVSIQNRSKELTKILKAFDSKETNADISTYLELFERQALRIEIDKSDFVTHLLGLLPLDIAQVITRVPQEVSNDYDHIKNVLLKRFKLTPEQFRQKFLFHKKENNSTWRDFAFELNHYFEEWIVGLEINDFKTLKELIITDQLKRRAPPEIKTHYIDEWHKLTKIDSVVEKIEEYETARFQIGKGNRAISDCNKYRKYEAHSESKQSTFRACSKDYDVGNSNNNNNYKKKCYACGGYGHKIAECRNRSVTRNTKPSNENKTINSITSLSLKKIQKNILVGNHPIIAVLDTGAEVTLISEKCYNQMGCPVLDRNQISLSGIGNQPVSTKGSFYSEINIDNCIIKAKIFVLDKLRFDAIIGMDVLSQLQFNFSKGEVKISSVNLIEVISVNNAYVHTNEIIPTVPNMSHFLSVSGAINCKEQSMILPSPPRADELAPGEFFALYTDLMNSAKAEIDLIHINNPQVRREIQELLHNYAPEKVTSTEVKMRIILRDEMPVFSRPRRLALAEQAIVEKQIQEWLKGGIIKPSCSDYASPIVLCKKKDGSARLCVDFRKLNSKLIKDRFPLPLIEDSIDRIADAQVFSSLDLKNGFLHVDIEESSTRYTSFVTHEGQYEFLKTPYGLATSPSVFERYVFHVFQELLRDKTVIIYVDDIIIPSKTEEEGLQKLKRVLATASKFGLELNFKKCRFLQRKIEFLGYIIEKGTVKPAPSKTAAVQNFPQPKNLKQIQSYLGLTGYFRKFIKDYAKIAKPLSDLLRDNKEFSFGPEQKRSFEELKKALTSDPILHIFRQGPKLELHTDASSFGFGAVLLQMGEDGQMHPLQYMSKKTTPQQEKYSSYELEILAVIEALKKFRNYLLGTKFTIVTDCSALQQTMSKKDLTPKIARWALLMEEFDYEIVHRPGVQMKHADALSRNVALIDTQSTVQVDEAVTYKVAAAQQRDEQVRVIKNLLEQGKEDNYLVKNQVLYRYDAGRELLVVPESMQTEIIRQVHKKGHFAIAKTEEMVKRDFYIPGLRKKIEGVIINCVECILCNKKGGKGEGYLNPIPKEDMPLKTYHIDFIGPLPSTSKKYQHIFTVIDAFTKFAWLYPVKTTSTQEVLNKLKNQQVTFGNPARIITDKGSAFRALEFAEYCEKEKIEHIQITTGIPRGNGQIERLHKTLIPVLAKLSIEDPAQWYKHVDTVQRVLNSTIVRSTKVTPFELLTGVPMKNREDLNVRNILEEEYNNWFMQTREDLRKDAKEQILKIQQENKKYYDQKRKKAQEYKVGDLVAILRTQFGTGLKLRVKYLGPYKVVRVKPKDRYDVEKVGLHEGPNVTSTAADNMKPWST